jgi:hypothetical protein
VQFTYPYYKTSKLQENPSALKREHPTLQNMKFFPIFGGLFALLDPDPDPLTLFFSFLFLLRIAPVNMLNDDLYRVSDPYSFFTDPDPDPVDPDGSQYGSGYGSGSNPDPGL